GDLGTSWRTGKPVATELLSRVPASLELLLLGTILGCLVGIPAGLAAAFGRSGWFDQLARVLSLLGFSIPTYFLGLLLLLIFFAELDWAPPAMGRINLMLTPPPHVTGSYLLDGLLDGDWEVVQSAAAQLILPVLSVAIICAAPVVKQVRAIALDVLGSDHIRYAGAQGLPRRLVRAMVLRGVAAPTFIFVCGELTGLIGSVSLIEYVFSWNGVGQYGLDAIVRGDFNVVQGYVLLLALFSVAVFLIGDLVVFALEPRSRVAA
ncbi:MAG: ABC transporter permease, partial [Acetobacteraceae bacterium]|nr:ABC transporter permease [Acetobacteraceae bacterium]